jgi:hypothetical protein
MNKAEERKLFDLLYVPKTPWTVSETESPDFVCSVDERFVLGVEITELFANDSDARLQKIPGYVAELTDQKKFRHSDDAKRLQVATFIYDPDGLNPQTVVGVLGQERTLADSAKRLVAVIRGKEAKAERYRTKAERVDLVIRDATNLFHFKEYDPFYFKLSAELDRIAILNSPFREIFLVTLANDKLVKVPLKLNLFAEDFQIFSRVIKEHPKYQDEGWRRQYFLRLAVCLKHFGYKDARLALKKPGLSIVFGAWEMGVWDGSQRIGDYVTNPHEMFSSEEISDEIEIHLGETTETLSALIEARKRLTCCFPFFFELSAGQAPAAAISS